MEPSELLREISIAFETIGVAYFVTGSTASILYGEPRFTNDIDVVVELSKRHVDELLRTFPPAEYYLSRGAMETAIQDRGQFNIIHPMSGLKADIIVASNSEFDRLRLQRRKMVQALPDKLVPFASPEDVILKKMVYYAEGGSDKHLRDIASMLTLRKVVIDREYIENWAKRLGVHDVWYKILQKLELPPS